jgi:selenoprotein W-related protein
MTPGETRHRFQGRAFWLARELLDARPDIADEITLVPSSGGVFLVRYDRETVWDNAAEGRFPEPKEVREAVLRASGRPPTPRAH